jgi:glycosyltransferase involved in cell wall biosynthesis
LERLASAGELPRKDYVELARALGADVLDAQYMERCASRAASAVARHGGLPAGQLLEAVLRGGRYQHVIAWADRLGLPLAALHKLAGLHRDLVMLSVWLSPPKKALFLRRLKVHSHLRAIVNYGSVQMEYAAAALGVPRDKLFLVSQPVDERFWRPPAAPVQEHVLAAVGSEGRDYPTLLRAVRGLDVQVELAVGHSFSASGDRRGKEVGARIGDVEREGLPPNVSLTTLSPSRLRELYARARFLIVPLQNLDYDAGVTAIVEAMAMSKAVIVTRTRGQVDVLRHGEQGLYVPPGDPRAMRVAIEYLLAHPEEADRMGRAGRALIEERHTLDGYTAKLVDIVRMVDEAAHAHRATRSTGHSS